MQQASFLYHEMPMQRIMREGRLRILCVWEGGGAQTFSRLETGTHRGGFIPSPPPTSAKNFELCEAYDI